MEGRFNVITQVRSPKTSILYIRDLTELIAACARHGLGPDSSVVVECSHPDEHNTYFELVAFKNVENHTTVPAVGGDRG